MAEPPSSAKRSVLCPPGVVGTRRRGWEQAELTEQLQGVWAAAELVMIMLSLAEITFSTVES